jgi:hypothetical protein
MLALYGFFLEGLPVDVLMTSAPREFVVRTETAVIHRYRKFAILANFAIARCLLA